MNWSLSLRAIAYLRRITRAAESVAASHATVANLLSAEYAAAHPTSRKVKTEFDVLDVAEANRRWREDRIADGLADSAADEDSDG